MIKIILLTSFLCVQHVTGYWDIGTSTIRLPYTDDTPRQSFFRWQWISFPQWWFWNYDWTEIHRRRKLNVMAGLSIDKLCLTTAVILNRRILISSYNPFDQYIVRQHDIRIWALGRSGLHNTPYRVVPHWPYKVNTCRECTTRYRVYRIHRLIPFSLNSEHCHGPHCIHQPRHDVSVIISLDQMYLYNSEPARYHYAYRAFLTEKYQILDGELWFAGSGFEYMEHILENYKIFFAIVERSNIVDCSVYIPKWWGKFICIRNTLHLAGLQDGGGLFTDKVVVGVGCFEIRINDDRIFVFTDLRYYYHLIHHYGYIWPGQYYEYAYPQWGIKLYWFYDRSGNNPYIPAWQVSNDLYPMGK